MEETGVPFMLTGSLAASFHGAPRATQDVDLVVEPNESALLGLASFLREQSFYVSDDAVREALELQGQFNCIDPGSGWKADFIIRKRRPFSESEFADRIPFQFLELDLAIARPEDLIVAKMEWARLGDSERQIADVVEIMRIQGEALDLARLHCTGRRVAMT